MEQARLLDQLVSKTAPGRAPDFTQAHILYALILLKDQRIGRKQLAEELHLGEGTTRTILSRLQDENFIEISRPGVTLSTHGREYLKAIETVLKWKPLSGTEITVDVVNWAVLVRGAAKRVKLGVEQRDQALIHGATGATTLVFRDGCWVIPGIDERLEHHVLDSLAGLNPSESDVAIIGTSSDSFTAILGALAAAIKLLS